MSAMTLYVRVNEDCKTTYIDYYLWVRGEYVLVGLHRGRGEKTRRHIDYGRDDVESPSDGSDVKWACDGL